MKIRNDISFSMPDEDLQAVKLALQTVEEKLQPHMITLLPDQRREMSKMGPRTSDFVATTMSFMRSMPQYVPGFVDLEEFQRDLDTVQVLRSLQHAVDRISDMISDSMMQAGSEAYSASLSCYAVLKTAAKHGSSEASAAASDLAERLPMRPPKTTPAPTGAPIAAPVNGATTA
jgi:hypothetical protein